MISPMSNLAITPEATTRRNTDDWWNDHVHNTRKKMSEARSWLDETKTKRKGTEEKKVEEKAEEPIKVFFFRKTQNSVQK